MAPENCWSTCWTTCLVSRNFFCNIFCFNSDRTCCQKLKSRSNQFDRPYDIFSLISILVGLPTNFVSETWSGRRKKDPCARPCRILHRVHCSWLVLTAVPTRSPSNPVQQRHASLASTLLYWFSLPRSIFTLKPPTIRVPDIWHVAPLNCPVDLSVRVTNHK